MKIIAKVRFFALWRPILDVQDKNSSVYDRFNIFCEKCAKIIKKRDGRNRKKAPRFVSGGLFKRLRFSFKQAYKSWNMALRDKARRVVVYMYCIRSGVNELDFVNVD